MPIAELLLVNPSTPPYRLAQKTRSASPAQMAARARFAEMARARAGGMRSNPDLVVKSRAAGAGAPPPRGPNVAAMLARSMGKASTTPTAKPPKAATVKPPRVTVKPPRVTVKPTAKPPKAATVKPPKVVTVKPTAKPPKAATVKPTKKPGAKAPSPAQLASRERFAQQARERSAAAKAAKESSVSKKPKKPTAKPSKKPTAKPSKKPTAKPSKKPTAKPSKKPPKARRPRGPAKAPALPESATAAQKRAHKALKGIYERLAKARIINKRGSKPSEERINAAHRDRWERRVASARKAARRLAWDVSTESRTVPKGLGGLVAKYGLSRVNPSSMSNVFAFSDVSKLAPEIGYGVASLALSAVVGQKIVDMIPADTQAKAGAAKPYLPAIASLLTGIAGYAAMRMLSKSSTDMYARGAVPTLYGGVFGATVHALIAAGKAAGLGIPQGMLAPAAPDAPAKAAAIPGATAAQTVSAVMSAAQATVADAMSQAAQAGQVGPTVSMSDSESGTAGIGASPYLISSGGTDVAVGEYAAISGDAAMAQLDEGRQGGRGLSLDPTVDSFYAQDHVLSGTVFG